MGNLLRRYWMPIAGVSEFETISIKPLRLFGEDLVLYKEYERHFGLVDRHCPHRRRSVVRLLSRTAASAATTTGGASTRRGAVSSSPMKTSRIPTRTSATKSVSRHIRSKQRADCCGPTWVRSRHRCCRIGSPFPGPTGSCKSRRRRFRATGCSVRKMRSIPCTSSGCTGTGPYGSTARTVRTGRSTSGLISKSSSSAIPITGWWKGCRRSRTLDGRADCALAELPWPQPAFRVARTDRRRQHALRHVALRARSERTRAVRANEHSVVEGPVTDPLTGRFITSHIANQDFVAWAGQGRTTDRTKNTSASATAASS